MYVASFNQSLMVSSGNVGIDLRVKNLYILVMQTILFLELTLFFLLVHSPHGVLVLLLYVPEKIDPSIKS